MSSYTVSQVASYLVQHIAIYLISNYLSIYPHIIFIYIFIYAHTHTYIYIYSLHILYMVYYNLYEFTQEELVPYPTHAGRIARISDPKQKSSYLLMEGGYVDYPVSNDVPDVFVHSTGW